MNRILSGLAAIALAASVAASAAPAAAQSPLQRVLDLNRQGMDAYMNLELEQAQSLLQQALQTAQSGGVTGAPLARTYLNLGVVAVGGFGDNGRGMNFFVQALQADSSIQLDPLTSTPEIQTVFQLARQRAGTGGGGGGGGGAGGGGGGGGAVGGGGGSGGGGGGGQAVGGNLPHQPVPEQLAQTAVPIYVEVPGDPAHVYVFYKATGMRDFRRVEMQPIADGYGYEVPCSDVFQPELQYYIVAFAGDGSPMGFAGSQNDPVTVPIVSSRSQPAPALPGRAPPETCTDAECPPGMEGCSSGGGGMGSTCRTDGDCGSGLVCEDDLCVTGDGDGNDGSDGDGGDDGAPRFFLHVGGGLGAAWVDGNMVADDVRPGETRFDGTMRPAAEHDPSSWVEAGMGDCTQDNRCVRVAQPGFVPHPQIRVAAGYYLLPFLGAAVWARFSPIAGRGTMSFLTLGGRLELQVTPPVENGFHASVFAGGGGGQVQVQPPGNGENAPYVVSGLGNISLGGYAGYRIMKNFGIVGQVDLMFMVPSFLFNLDLTVNAAVTF
jgi:hypothetical protein